MKKLKRLYCAVLALILLTPQSAKAVTNGQLDTFEDGTTMDWSVSGQVPIRLPIRQTVVPRVLETPISG